MFLKSSFAVWITVLFIVAACVPQTAQPVPEEVLPVETIFTESVPPTEIAPAMRESPVSALWVEYRDDRYGVGLAFPCWWVFTPMPTEGYGGAMTLRSFDEDYFRAHSTKGNWNGDVPPEGVYALDIGVFEGFDPSLTVTDAWASLNDPSMSVIVSAEERIIGQNQATVVQMLNVDNDNGDISTLYLFPLSPDKILMVSPLLQDRLDAIDVQSILSSISLNPDVPIQVPTVAPHEPLMPAACAGN